MGCNIFGSSIVSMRYFYNFDIAYLLWQNCSMIVSNINCEKTERVVERQDLHHFHKE